MKKEPMGSERDQNKWLGNTLRQSPAPAPGSGSCPDAETLAAWADGGLNAQAAAAVESHASTCAHCIAVIAAMERGAPAPAEPVWAPARLFRWLVPLTAAVTAVAIWIAVPDRRIATVQPAPAHDSAAVEPGTPKAEPASPDPEPGTGRPEPGAPRAFTQPAPSARVDDPAIDTQLQLRDEMRRESAAAEALGAASAPPPVAAPPSVSTDALAENATTAAPAQRPALAARVAITSESISPLNELFRWRVVGNISIERSTDGGKTWTKTIPIPGVVPANPSALTIRSIRAISDVSATATTSDGRDFYTSNGGLSWIPPVQEKAAAPF